MHTIFCGALLRNVLVLQMQGMTNSVFVRIGHRNAYTPVPLCFYNEDKLGNGLRWQKYANVLPVGAAGMCMPPKEGTHAALLSVVSKASRSSSKKAAESVHT